jgi:hypothetical protein
MVTQNGEEAKVTLSFADFEQTQETLALLKMFAQSQQTVREGKSLSPLIVALQKGNFQKGHYYMYWNVWIITEMNCSITGNSMIC